MRGGGEPPPLFRLMRVRSSVNPFWISRQKSSSSAIAAGGRPATAPTVRTTWARASLVSAGTVGRAAEAETSEPRKRRRDVTVRSPVGGDVLGFSANASAGPETGGACPFNPFPAGLPSYPRLARPPAPTSPASPPPGRRFYGQRAARCRAPPVTT